MQTTTKGRQTITQVKKTPKKRFKKTITESKTSTKRAKTMTNDAKGPQKDTKLQH